MPVQYREYRVGEIFNIESTRGIYHACNVNIEPSKTAENHPYVVRTSQNNGIRGYIVEDESTLNPGNTISFAQDTAQMFYQAEPYFTGNKMKVMSIKWHDMNEKLALFLIACLKQGFSSFAWGQSYDVGILSNVKIALPTRSSITPDWNALTVNITRGGGIDMSKIDTSNWRPFKISELFTAVSGDTDLQQKDVNGKGVYLVSAGETNAGIIGKTDVEAKIIPENTLTVDMFGNVYYRDFPYKMVTHARVCAILPKFNMTREIGLFMATTIQKITANYSYNNMCSWNKIQNQEIYLPAKETTEPDWDYMRDRIAELEADRIAELEADRIAVVERYLVTTGLNDYELDDEEKEIFTSDFSTLSAKGVTKEFMVTSLFECSRGTRLTKQERTPGNIPLCTAGVGIGQGVAEFIGSNTKMQLYENDITIDMFGLTYYHDYAHYGDDNIHFLVNQDLSDLAKIYITVALQKRVTGYSYGKQFRMNNLRELSVALPIQTSSSGTPLIDPSHRYHPAGYIPDWDYMAKYIRAIEKMVIKDVVKYKDEVIAKTKAVVAGKA